jgi:hypothetical protein
MPDVRLPYEFSAPLPTARLVLRTMTLTLSAGQEALSVRSSNANSSAKWRSHAASS